MTICATILSGNSEELIGEAIRSVREWVDQVLLIDTGITDGTLAIAKQLADQRLFVEKFLWINDFAAARNFALDVAACHGARWALTLDTDERLQFPGIRTPDELQSRLDAEGRVRAWLVSYRDGSYAKERFIRVDDRGGATETGPPAAKRRLLWSGRTHECLTGAAAGERATLPGVTVWEVAKSPQQFQAKLARDLEVLLEETRLKPQEPRWWYYLGQTYEGLHRHREALHAFRSCAALRQGWLEQAAWACYRAASCALQLNEPEEALELCALGLARQPESPELAWLAGFVCYSQKRFVAAVTWSRLAITLGHFEGQQAGRSRIGFRHLPGWYEGPYDVLRHAYRQLGQNAIAAECEAKFAAAKEQRERFCDGGDSPAVNSPAPPPQPRGLHARPDTRRAATTRVAVLGLYSSGSTATATMLHRLGVVLGRGLFGDYYEPLWLSAQLRAWWQEPDLVETISRQDRVDVLKRWIDDLQRDGHPCIGAKHPLLALCGAELREAWGPEARFIWTWRPLEESILSLERRGWWPGQERRLQTQLWSAAESFFESQSHLRVEFASVLSDPQREVDRLIEFLGLQPTSSQRKAAVAAIVPRVPPLAGKRILFDLGAHFGEGLVKLRDELRLDHTWEIHAFEPNPHCRSREYLDRCGLHATFHNKAVWTRDGRVAFRPQERERDVHLSSADDPLPCDGWGSCVGDARSRVPRLATEIEVPCVDFSRLLAERSADDHIVVKMDIEGAEFPVLRQIIERGLLDRIKILFIEWHDRLVDGESPQTRRQLEQQLIDAGVKVLPWD